MEEKERYKWSQDIIVGCPYDDYDYIVDTENNIIFDDDNFFKLIDYLNQQDKQIKELEQENEKLFAEAYFKSYEYCQNKIVKENVVIKEENNKIFEENQQLKQQLNNVDYYKNYCELKSYSDDMIKGLTEQCQQLKQQLEEQNKIIEAYEQENQALKDRWEKLKEWLMYTLEEKQISPKYYKFNNVLDKMKELEKED